ncbi:MAG: Lrp/AsnC family leucine-responsive transcriptional regulator [Gammaproteobacteria bacterium]|jgi:Lrp/AsnC family leucine-responsive transcriptional regulator
MPISTLDRIDYRILHFIQNDARMTNAELALQVGLSPSPCLRRVKTLEREGIIRRYVGIVDATAVGLPISAFVNISLHSQERKALEIFQSQVQTYAEVMECYLMTGSSDFLMRVVVPDLQSYERFADKLTRIPGISNIQTSFALKPVIYKTELPLDASVHSGSQ